MGCAVMAELERRVAQLEGFMDAAERRLARVRAASAGPLGWPADWPQPTESTACRASAFRSGVLAFRDGKQKSDCPYGWKSRGYDTAWLRGWIAAKRTWGSPPKR